MSHGSRKKQIDIAALMECVVKTRYTTVPRTDYFNLLVVYGEDAFTEAMLYSAWEEFHSRRGDPIKVRGLYLRKLLEAEHESE